MPTVARALPSEGCTCPRINIDVGWSTPQWHMSYGVDGILGKIFQPAARSRTGGRQRGCVAAARVGSAPSPAAGRLPVPRCLGDQFRRPDFLCGRHTYRKKQIKIETGSARERAHARKLAGGAGGPRSPLAAAGPSESGSIPATPWKAARAAAVAGPAAPSSAPLCRYTK
jgi:hypothetical protein